jgi:DNA-binding transcriptional regulator YhcF (GntR family)
MNESHVINSRRLPPKPLFQQICDLILSDIRSGKLALGDKLPSIHSASRVFSLAPGTVKKAYDDLRQRGIISSHQGKGFFISSTEISVQKRVFLLFDRLNAYKEILYYSFIEEMPADIIVEVFFHHYDIKLFEKLVLENIGKYTHFVIMPHFEDDISLLMRKINSSQLFLLDKIDQRIQGNYGAVYQDFQYDVYQALKAGKHLIKKYQKINLIRSSSKFQYIPAALIEGFQQFCKELQMEYEVMNGFRPQRLERDNIYLVFPDNELIGILKYLQEQNWQPGRDIGLISYDDTPMKELLAGGITTISTDFRQMGKTLAIMILENRREKIANPSELIIRKSL